jgi:hypothetical protein
MNAKSEREPIIKTCESCGTEFQAKTTRARRCRKNCGRKDTRRGPRASKNAARAKRRAESGVTFVAIDGEGYNHTISDFEWEEIDDEMIEVPVKRVVHTYNMLSVGDDTLVTPDGSHITYDAALQFIWDTAEEHRAQGVERLCLVGFFLGYDFIQIFRTLPEKPAWKLFTKAGQEARRAMQRKHGWKRIPKVSVGPWKLDMMAGKRLTICHRDHPGVTVTVCDVGSFFQTSFVTAINPKDWLEPVCTDEEFEIIVRGKALRGGTMTVAEQLAAVPETIQYNLTENAVLARLMQRLDEGFRKSGIHLRADQYYGPGQAAQHWMKIIDAPTTEDLAEALPLHMFKVAQASYYGGWFEIFAHGHIPGTTREYDITSAYPSIIRRLPCLICGEWQPNHEGELRIAKYHVRGPDDAVTGPLPHRRRDGSILRPLETRGYYWSDEVEAAERAGLIDEYVSVEDRWSFHPASCSHRSRYPFREIEDLFLERIKVGKKSPAGKALKLVYNSAYGKTAQSVGSPKYASPVYASLITSGCRVMILNAIASHPQKARALVMVATDAVFFRTPHPSLDMRENTLGAWEEEPKENLTLYMPGVYWDDATRASVKAPGGKLKLKSRGISAVELAKYIDAIDREFDEWDGVSYSDEDQVRESRWPSLALYSEFGLVSLSQALDRGKWWTAGALMTYEEDGRVITGVKRVITSDATPKRAADHYDHVWECGRLAWDVDIWRSRPYAAVMIDGQPMPDTTPYDKSFGHELTEVDVADAATMQEGDAIGAMIRFINGTEG